MIPMPLPTIYALKFRPDLKININIARLRDEKEQLRKNGDEFGWGNCRYDIAENFWGDKLCRSAYKRSPDERHDADFILITHDHYDHFSPEYISKIAKLGSILVVPEKMSAKAREVADAVGRIETVKG